MRTRMTLLFLTLLVLGCASGQKAPVTHIECATLYSGEVKRMERVGTADTVAAFVSITTTDEKSFDALPFVFYHFTCLGNSLNYLGHSDLNGKVRMILPAGTYVFRVSYPGYHELASKQMELKEGEIWKIETILASQEPAAKHKKSNRNR